MEEETVSLEEAEEKEVFKAKTFIIRFKPLKVKAKNSKELDSKVFILLNGTDIEVSDIEEE